LELLPNFLPDMSVLRVNPAQGSFEGVHMFKLKFASPYIFDTLHNFDQPAARFNSLVPKE
jgi:hypothetical protein